MIGPRSQSLGVIKPKFNSGHYDSKSHAASQHREEGEEEEREGKRRDTCEERMGLRDTRKVKKAGGRVSQQPASFAMSGHGDRAHAYVLTSHHLPSLCF